MNIREYLDSTYLKTADQAHLTEIENNTIALEFINQAIEEQFKLIMIRPEQVKVARERIDEAKSNVFVGTVIDFPLGQSGLEFKLHEAKQALEDGADELDFVCDYMGFKNGKIEAFLEEIITCTKLILNHHKKIKWIIEVAALTPEEIINITNVIKNCIQESFDRDFHSHIFIKSSTGFYVTNDGKPNGATKESIRLMIEHAENLPVKAAGGVKSLSEAVEMIQLGVKRIGTSSAKAIVEGLTSTESY